MGRRRVERVRQVSDPIGGVLDFWQNLKRAERGEVVADDPAGKIAAARRRPFVTFAVVMDDKIVKIEMPWTKIIETSEAGISEYILKQMREARDTAH